MLRIYPVVLRTIEGLRRTLGILDHKDRDLSRQLRRCSASCALNLGEGQYSRGNCNFRDERREGGCTVTRLLFIGRAQEGPEGWEHLRTILRVKTITVRSNGCTTTDERYLMSSLASDRLSPRQWQTIIRLRWGVETCHQILDTALSEDDHPWITGHPRGMVVVAILRRIVFTLLAIYRAITQRSDERRQMPWKLLLEEIWTVLITALALMPAASVERPPIRLQRPTTRTRPRGPPIKGARARRGA